MMERNLIGLRLSISVKKSKWSRRFLQLDKETCPLFSSNTKTDMGLNTLNKGVFRSDTVMVVLVNNLWPIQSLSKCHDMRIRIDITQACIKPTSVAKVNHELVRESYWLRWGIS
jgi:hypothetical protein